MSRTFGVVCGGMSSEFDISIKSGTTILNNLPESDNAYMIILDYEGWRIRVGNQEIPFNHSDFTFLLNGERIKIDVAIIYIHGDPGENGKIQAYLDIIGVPYINSGPLASELSFDKWYCNQFLKGLGFLVADSILLTDKNNLPTETEVEEKLKLPLFVKPADSGSSYGIAKVNSSTDLIPAIQNAFKEGKTVVLESFLKGREVTCGVYQNENGVHALPITEIISRNEFFDFEAKYAGLSEEITPADIHPDISINVQKISKEIYKIMNLKSIARIDFMLVNDQPYIIEVNTTPGFSNESIVPKMIKTEGKSIKEFWEEIISFELD